MAPRATNRAQARHQSQPSATSATPATRNEGWCEQVPRLPAKRWSMSPSATPATQMSPSERWFVKRGPRRTRRRSGRRRDGYRIKNKNPTQRCGEKYLHAKILDSRFSILDSRSSSKTNSRFSILDPAFRFFDIELHLSVSIENISIYLSIYHYVRPPSYKLVYKPQ